MKKGDPFLSPKLLVKGARESANRLDGKWRHFHERCFGIPFMQDNPDAGYKSLKFRICPELPQELRVDASDALNNIRHALDQAVNCAAFELGSTKRNNYFPFAKDAGDIDRVIKDNCPTVVAELLPCLKAFRPYGGGDEPLYQFSRLIGPNKHQIILDLHFQPSAIGIMGSGSCITELGGPFRAGILDWNRDKQELEAVRVWGGGYVKYQAMTNIAAFVAFSDGKVSAGEPAATFINTMASKVDGIIRTIESETVRLKGI